ncbi:MAG: hypothetical protein LBU65_06010, partial [Planctomycetaceae bacterium]|nr:hypothetical protein [Planctomycetaceae bacterium]
MTNNTPTNSLSTVFNAMKLLCNKSLIYIIVFLLLSFIVTPLIANEPVPPPKVSTSTGIYDIKSADEIYKFTAAEIRELVKMEDARTRG